jgi:hypothetical protein
MSANPVFSELTAVALIVGKTVEVLRRCNDQRYPRWCALKE